MQTFNSDADIVVRLLSPYLQYTGGDVAGWGGYGGEWGGVVVCTHVNKASVLLK